MKPVIRYRNYSGPQGDYGVVNGKTVPFTGDAARCMAQRAHLLALGAPEYAEAMNRSAAEAAETSRAAAAAA